jgi:hypothetical protein
MKSGQPLWHHNIWLQLHTTPTFAENYKIIDHGCSLAAVQWLQLHSTSFFAIKKSINQSSCSFTVFR